MSSTAKSSFFQRLRSRRILLIAAGMILLAAAGGTGFYFWKTRATKAQGQSSAAQTATVTRGNIELSASGTGTLISPSKVTFGFDASGQVTKVLVKTGDVVDAGQLLAKLDDTAAQVEYTQALRALDALTSAEAIASAKLAIATDEVNAENYRSILAYLVSPAVVYWEEEVTKAQMVLAEAQAAAAASPSADAEAAVQKAQTTLTADQNSLAQAWLDYWNDYVPDTFVTIVKSGRTSTKEIISPTQADISSARANYALAKASLSEDQDYLTAITTGTIPDGATGSKITAFKTAQDAVTAAKKTLDETSLYAPIHGTVLSLGFNVGDMASSSTTVTVADLDQPYTLEIYMDQTDWSNVQAGFSANVTFDLLSSSVYTGKVLSVDPDLTDTNGSLYVHAYVLLDTSVKIALPLGTSASVDIIGGKATNALLIPLEALHRDSSGGYTVYVMINGQPQARSVEIGLEDATRAEVKSGLSEGDVVSTGTTVTK